MARPDDRGNSFALGLESAGASVCNGMWERPKGSFSIWDHLEPGLPQ